MAMYCWVRAPSLSLALPSRALVNHAHFSLMQCDALWSFYVSDSFGIFTTKNYLMCTVWYFLLTHLCRLLSLLPSQNKIILCRIRNNDNLCGFVICTANIYRYDCATEHRLPKLQCYTIYIIVCVQIFFIFYL